MLCRTLAIGAKQFVVQEAAAIISSLFFKIFSFTPNTIFIEPLHGAETKTFLAPELICCDDFSLVLNLPVHSKTISTLYFFQSIFEISVSRIKLIFFHLT